MAAVGALPATRSSPVEADLGNPALANRSHDGDGGGVAGSCAAGAAGSRDRDGGAMRPCVKRSPAGESPRRGRREGGESTMIVTVDPTL